MKLKHSIVAVLFMAAINFTPAIVHAQSFDGGDFGEGDPDAEGNNTNVPFDGGISMLVAAGVAYGLKKKYDANKPSTKE